MKGKSECLLPLLHTLVEERAGERRFPANPPPFMSQPCFLQNSDFFKLTEFLAFVILMPMNMTQGANAVWFTTKGQVVIPLRLRKQFHIEDGTKAIVEATADGILLKPVTAVTIRRLRGILKRKPGEKPLAGEMAEHKRAEKELEEAKYARTGSR